MAVQCHDTAVGPQRRRRTIAETDTVHAPAFSSSAGRSEQVFGAGQYAGCPDTDARGFRGLVQIGVIREHAANLRFGLVQLLRQLLDLQGIWKPVISYKLLNLNEGRVASKMCFKTSARAGHLLSHNTIVVYELLRAFGSMHAFHKVEPSGERVRASDSLITQTRINPENEIVRNKRTI